MDATGGWECVQQAQHAISLKVKEYALKTAHHAPATQIAWFVTVKITFSLMPLATFALLQPAQAINI